MDVDESEIRDEYHTLVRDVFGDRVREVNSHYPSELSVRMDWQEIERFDEDLAERFLSSPEQARGSTKEAIKYWDEVDIPEVVVRVHNIPDEYHFRVGKQRTVHLGGLVSIEGEVVEMEGVQPFAREAALECRKCGMLHHQPQTYGKMMEPPECMGCESRSSTYIFHRGQSDLIDYRQVILQRTDTNLDDDPPTLVVYLTQDLVDRIGPGDYVSLVGYYDTGMIQRESVLSTYLDTWDIESQEAGVLADKLSPEEIREMVVEAVEDLQDSDPSSFGADREAVVERITDGGVREKEVEDAIDDLLDDAAISEVNGGKLMVT
jgi:DNA replicative helicase MCM subunit Mcm2 (Cdc46/Mcm family)